MPELNNLLSGATDVLGEGVVLVCTFRLGQQWFGVDARWVQEINTRIVVTPIPHAPAAVHGYVNLRGHLRLALDLRDILGAGQPTDDVQPRLIVFKPAAGESFAILVDQVGDIVSVTSDQIDRPSLSTTRGGEGPESVAQSLLTGFAKLEQQLIALLEPRRFLAAVIRPQLNT